MKKKRVQTAYSYMYDLLPYNSSAPVLHHVRAPPDANWRIIGDKYNYIQN